MFVFPHIYFLWRNNDSIPCWKDTIYLLIRNLKHLQEQASNAGHIQVVQPLLMAGAWKWTCTVRGTAIPTPGAGVRGTASTRTLHFARYKFSRTRCA